MAEAEKAKKEAASGDVLPFTSTKDRGADEVEALLKHYGAKTSPARVAELIVEHGSQKKIHEYIEKHSKSLGAHFWKKVVDALPRAKKADHVNVGFDHLNPSHQGTGTTGNDPNRLAEHTETTGADGKTHDTLTNAHTALATHVYTNDGKSVHDVGVGAEVKLNTGAVKKLEIDGKPTDCVFGFHVGGVSGWVPVESLDDVGKRLAVVDKKIAGEVTAKHKGMQFDHKHARTVVARAAPAEFDDLRLAASTKHTTGNQPHDYYDRGHGAVNFLSNVPNTGDNDEKKFGIADDIVANGTTFIPAEPRLEKSVQLFKDGTKTLTTHKITFIYGKAEKDGNPASFGWINAACLSEASHKA